MNQAMSNRLFRRAIHGPMLRPRRRDESDLEYENQAGTSYLVVLPVITSTYADRCIASILDPNGSSGLKPENVLVVDNSLTGAFKMLSMAGVDPWGKVSVYRDPGGHNLGVARSWNIGARAVLEGGLDYLVICSASMLFGPIYHATFIRDLAKARAMEGGPANVVEAIGHSWHLIAFHRKVFETVGTFDGAFYPAYMEAIDFGRRMALAGMEGGPLWQNVWVYAILQAVGGHINAVRCPAPPLLKVYRDKWGGDKGAEQYQLPEGNRPLDYVREEPIPVLADRYGLGIEGEDWW